ncbi:cytochrome p450 [Neofusicoccum parvum]|nr:cytochrome p450 [Neofusicoccum parvum]
MGILSSPAVLTALAILVTLGLYRLSHVGRRDPRLPPGPPTIPVLGNLHLIPITGMHKDLLAWGEKYGSVFSLKLGPGTMIVLNDRKAVHELLDKRSALYSDRPKDYMAKLVTNLDNMAHMHNDHIWRAQRKVAAHNLSPRLLDANVAPLQEAEMAILLHDLLRTPNKFFDHIKRSTGSVANIIIWGHRGATYESFWGYNVYRSLEGYSRSLEIGANPPVDQFPFLQRIPDFLAPWKRRAKLSYKIMADTWAEARRLAEKRRAAGERRPAMFDRIVDGETKLDVRHTDTQLNHFLGTMVEAGAETSASGMLTSLLYLAISPQVQAKAHKELDEVCGSERSPKWSDLERLPYINCIVKEGMRIRPVGPLGVPHCAKQDDWYNGFLIPKDAMILMPIWAIHRYESNGFENPDQYNPDRYMNHKRLGSELTGIPDYENRDNYGAGRRVCVGMHLAERTVWRMTAKILWAYELVPVDVDPSNFHEGIQHYPEPFKVEFRPRSEAHVRTIVREAEPALEFLSKYE